MTFNNKDYQEVDFTKVYSKANEYLVTSSVIETFPFKIGKFISEQSDVRLCSYAKALSKYNINIKCFGSESAVIIEQEGYYIIFYNNSEPAYRVRFSIAHEFSHYIFGHKMNLDETDPLYHKQETEANCFAAQLLMPEQIIRMAIKRNQLMNINNIMKFFDVSEEAAQKRRITLCKYDYEWRKREEREFDDILLNKYNEFINSFLYNSKCR